MKKFEMPEIQVEVFAVEDVITTSYYETENENDLPISPAYIPISDL